MCSGVHQDEGVDAQEGSDHHSDIEEVSPSQDYPEVANLLGNDLVLEGVESKEVGLLDVVEALGALVDGLLGQADQEWHHQHAEQAEDEDGQDRQKVAKQIRLVGNDGVGDRVAMRALDFLRFLFKQYLLLLFLSLCENEGGGTHLRSRDDRSVLKFSRVHFVLG